jgi:hypothetical protein
MPRPPCAPGPPRARRAPPRRLLEQIEDSRQHLGGDADPVVLHGHDQLPIACDNVQLDVAAGIGVAGGVGQ